MYNDKDHGSDLFNPKSGLFWPSFYVTLGALVAIIIFGIVYEIARKMIWNTGKISFNSQDSLDRKIEFSRIF